MDRRTISSRDPGSIGAAFHPIESQPFKAAPSSGAAGDLAPWDGGTNPACRRHTLLCQLSVPRRHPQLSKAWPVYRVGKRRKDCCDFECEFSGDRKNSGLRTYRPHFPRCAIPSVRPLWTPGCSPNWWHASDEDFIDPPAVKIRPLEPPAECIEG